MPTYFQRIDVECYSGHRFGEQPRSFLWQGEKYLVQHIESAWLEPGHRHFRLLTIGDGRFELVYNEQIDIWEAVQLIG
jgi:hypothetical protein